MSRKNSSDKDGGFRFYPHATSSPFSFLQKYSPGKRAGILVLASPRELVRSFPIFTGRLFLPSLDRSRNSEYDEKGFNSGKKKVNECPLIL